MTTGSGSLLAQALEVPNLTHHPHHNDNGGGNDNNDDDENNSSFPALSITSSARSTPRNSYQFPDLPCEDDGLLFQHSDYTVPTSNIHHHPELLQQQLQDHLATNDPVKSRYFPKSPPAEITPHKQQQKRRGVFANEVKNRYHIAPTVSNHHPLHPTSARTTTTSAPTTPIQQRSLSLSPPQSPTQRLLDISQNPTPVVSPLTPYDRQRLVRDHHPKHHHHHHSKKPKKQPNMKKLIIQPAPRRLHETIHAQSLFIGLAFMAIWTPNNIMAPNLTQMATTTFDMTPEQRDLYLGSYCALAVGVFSLPISALLGFMVDFYSRKNLYVFCVLGGSLATAWTAASTTFWSLFLARLVTGGFMSASVPVAFSLLGDLFSTEERNAASSGLTSMMGLGILAGQVYSGLVGPSLGWPHPFVVSSALSLTSAVAVAIWVQEPDRGAKEKVLQELLENGNKYERKLTFQGFVHAMQTNMSNKMLLWSGFFTSLPWGIIFVFLNDYLSQEKGFSVQDATFMVMLFGIGCAIGGIGGGYFGQGLQQYNRSYLPLYMAAATFLGTIPFLALLNSEFPNHHGYKAMIYSITGGFIATLPSVNVRPCILNVNPPETRGAALTAANLLVALGRGIGPSCITLLGSTFSVSRQTAFNTTLVVFWTITAIQYLFLAKTLPQDQDKMEAELAQYATSMATRNASADSDDRDEEQGDDTTNNNNHEAELTPLTMRREASSTNSLYLDEGASMMSMEEYITSFDGRAARRSFVMARQGIREIKDEMTCMTTACGGGGDTTMQYSSSSSSSSSSDEDSPGTLERRKEAWKRRQQHNNTNKLSSLSSSSSSFEDAQDGTGKNSLELPANEKTPLLIV